MVKRLARHSCLLPVLVLLAICVATAQENGTGSLTGTVTDQQDKVIQGAKIRAENVRTKESILTAETDETGFWEITNVPIGSYTITITAQDFGKETIKDVEVDSGAIAIVDRSLQVEFDFEGSDTTVTASRYEEEVIDTPATVTIIPEGAIMKSPSVNLGELLPSVPGMNVAQTSAREFNITSRSATGLFSGTQLALIDGRTIYHDDFGYLCWDGQATNLTELKQVEIIRGPASSIWGSNAMNGILFI